MQIEKNPSDIIQQFIDFIENSIKEYDEAGTIVNLEDKKVQDFLHEIEFSSNYKERSKISTCLHESRSKRRKAKDKQIKLEKIANFYTNQGNKVFIKALKRLVSEQKTKECYLSGERHYNKRGDNSE